MISPVRGISLSGLSAHGKSGTSSSDSGGRGNSCLWLQTWNVSGKKTIFSEYHLRALG